jgi:nucleotide-binding universal stress UspA family protein
MFKHVLIATDGSELADQAAAQGFELAKVLNAKVTVVTVTESWAAAVPGEMVLALPQAEYDKTAAKRAALILSAVTDTAKKMDLSLSTVHVKNQFPAEGILATAKDNGCDLVIMASHGRRGLAKLLLGSEATKVLTLGALPVLICR